MELCDIGGQLMKNVKRGKTDDHSKPYPINDPEINAGNTTEFPISHAIQETIETWRDNFYKNLELRKKQE